MGDDKTESNRVCYRETKKKNRSGWRGSYTDNDIFRTIKNRTTRIVQYSAGRGDRQRAAEVL